MLGAQSVCGQHRRLSELFPLACEQSLLVSLYREGQLPVTLAMTVIFPSPCSLC